MISMTILFAQDVPVDNPVQSLLTDTIAQVIALFMVALLNLVIYAVNRYFKIKINKDKVIAFIAEKSAEAKALNLTEEQKKGYVVEHIKNDKEISKWTNIFFRTASAGAELVYRNIIKKRK